jgi:pimeloyl-ACP methyl ester carboxylesterase
LAIYRYYDAVSRAFGDDSRPNMETYGWGLGRLILDLLDATGAAGVYLVAHSMGGLVARTFLQNPIALDDSTAATGRRCAAVAALLARAEPDDHASRLGARFSVARKSPTFCRTNLPRWLPDCRQEELGFRKSALHCSLPEV